jgi:hypothetical protein
LVLLNIREESDKIQFLADKVYAHYWPLDSQKWDNFVIQQIDQNLNKNNKKKSVLINGESIQIVDFEFIQIKKIGLTIPLFKKQSIMIFEGSFNQYSAHVHITIQSDDYLDIFNKLVHWRSRNFPDLSPS